MFDERKEVVSGSKAVGTFDVADDGEAGGGKERNGLADKAHTSGPADGPLPEFWLTAFSNHDKISPFITERDNEVLAFLEVGVVYAVELLRFHIFTGTPGCPR